MAKQQIKGKECMRSKKLQDLGGENTNGGVGCFRSAIKTYESSCILPFYYYILSFPNSFFFLNTLTADIAVPPMQERFL
jgi:hypothetical protein